MHWETRMNLMAVLLKKWRQGMFLYMRTTSTFTCQLLQWLVGICLLPLLSSQPLYRQLSVTIFFQFLLLLLLLRSCWVTIRLFFFQFIHYSSSFIIIINFSLLLLFPFLFSSSSSSSFSSCHHLLLIFILLYNWNFL